MFQNMPEHFLGGDSDVWKRFIDRLERRGLCLQAKAAGLRRWSGWGHVFDREEAYCAYRAIHHIKLDIVGESIAARAYLFIKFLPASTSRAWKGETKKA